ncbi:MULTISPECIES: hypothetical protein [Serratia]|uniref:hypothetical protein n=1 Tax=Serratia TaxID=613 RepID=UPI001E39B629|nr:MULTISPECIES: hypothetical protein [Serratia]MDP8636123.1 hypothetical protein [Serratia marcescens]MDP8869623.1 hypothetical protein [Serratia marcescens]
MNKTLLFLLFITFNTMAAVNCSTLDQAAQTHSTHIENSNNGFSVIGKGRLYFHSAPDLRCKESEVFIIPNDKVNAYLDYHGYYYVMYFNRKGEQVEGWVDSNRLKENNTGIGPVEK